MTTPLPAPASATLPMRHLLLGLAVVAVWGTNFGVIKYALAHLPPLPDGLTPVWQLLAGRVH